MWPFTRKQPAQPPEAGPSVPQVRFDWKHVPAIQRTVGSHPLTVQTAAFAGGLATHADPRAVAEPLGHRVTLEAPPGLILDFVRPQTRNQGPELIPRSHASHQRPVQRTRTASAAPDVEEAPMLATFDEVTAHGDEPIRRLPASAEPRPVLSLMRVSSETEPTPLPSRFEAPPALDHPADAATQVAPETDSAPELPAYPRLTLGQVRRLGLGAPIARVPETASTVQRSRASDEVPPYAEPLPAPETAVETPAPAEAPQFQPFALDYLITKEAPPPAPTPLSRRQRIGPTLSVSRSAEQDKIIAAGAAPELEGPEKSKEPSLSGSTASTAIQRQAVEDEGEPAPLQRTSDGPAPAHNADGPTSDGAGEAPLQRSQTVELAGATPMVETSTSPLLSAPPSGEAAEGPGATLPALPLAAATAVPALQRQAVSADEPAGDDRESAPLVSAAPATASLELRQAVPEMEPPTGTLGAEPTTVMTTTLNDLSHRSTSTSGASMQFPAPTRTASLPVAQRLSPSTTIDPVKAPALQRAIEVPSTTRPIAPASTLPLLSRPILSSSSAEPERALPTLPSPAMEPLSEMRRAAPAAVIQRAADPESALPLAPVMRAHQETATTPRISSTESAGAPPSFFADSAFEAGPLPNLPAAIQRSASQEWSLQTAPADSAAVESPAAVHPAAEGTGDHTDFDALATKLYDRIRGKLRHELLIDRERAGMLTDLR